MGGGFRVALLGGTSHAGKSTTARAVAASLGWEAISRRRVNQRIEATIHMVGVLSFLTLIVFITFKNDFHFDKIASWFHR